MYALFVQICTFCSVLVVRQYHLGASKGLVIDDGQYSAHRSQGAAHAVKTRPAEIITSMC